MNQFENKCVLDTADIAAHLKPKSKTLTDVELQQDYNYFKAEEVIKMLLSNGLISLSEFNKIRQLNRETFSPLWVEIMPQNS